MEVAGMERNVIEMTVPSFTVGALASSSARPGGPRRPSTTERGNQIVVIWSSFLLCQQLVSGIFFLFSIYHLYLFRNEGFKIVEIPRRKCDRFLSSAPTTSR